MPPGPLLAEVFQECPAGRRLWSGPRTLWSVLGVLVWERFEESIESHDSHDSSRFRVQ